MNDDSDSEPSEWAIRIRIGRELEAYDAWITGRSDIPVP